MTGALQQLAAYYNDDEVRQFARDIGTLFGGLPDRFDEPDTWPAISQPPLPRHVWAYLRREGMPGALMGVDLDANVHHWAWAFTMGGGLVPGQGMLINSGRESQGFIRDLRQNPLNVNYGNYYADVTLGNLGALQGAMVGRLGPRSAASVWLLTSWLKYLLP